MTLQEKDLDGIKIQYADRNVKVSCNDNLKQLLASRKDASLALAGYLLEEYCRIKGEPLYISQDSLAIELIGHAFIDEWFSKMQNCPESIPDVLRDALDKLADKIHVSTTIIDCGDKTVDTNRFIWDMLVPFKELIYSLHILPNPTHRSAE